MLPRQFKLTNSKGEVLDLLNQNGPMFFEPEGLGYEDTSDWLRLGTTFLPVNVALGQRSIAGKMYFLGEDKAYKTYFDFVRFVRNSPLTMEYTTHDTFYIDVVAQSIDKTELTTYGVLECKIKFTALGPFYKYVTTSYTPQEQLVPANIVDDIDDQIVDSNANQLITGVPNYDDTYDYVYSDIYPREDLNSVSMDIETVEDSPMRITIYGPCTNPVWQQYVDGHLIASGKYNGILEQDDYLVVDPTVVPYKIYMFDHDGSVISDMYGSCDFSTERFLFAKGGSNSISVSHEGVDEEIRFTVEVKMCYASV